MRIGRGSIKCFRELLPPPTRISGRAGRDSGRGFRSVRQAEICTANLKISRHKRADSARPLIHLALGPFVQQADRVRNTIEGILRAFVWPSLVTDDTSDVTSKENNEGADTQASVPSYLPQAPQSRPSSLPNSCDTTPRRSSHTCRGGPTRRS